MKGPKDMVEPQIYDLLSPTEKRVLREAYAADQKGLCFFCKAPLTGPPTKEVVKKRLNMKLFPPDFLKYPVHLQHDHKTGLTEGAVHSKCNGVMWQYHGR